MNAPTSFNKEPVASALPKITVVTPVYEVPLSAFKINEPVPVPSFVIPPAPLIVVVILISPVVLIPKVNNAVFVICVVLILIAVVASFSILDAEDDVIPPVNVVADANAICLKAPLTADDSENPVPLILISSGIVNALDPLNSIAAGLDTVVNDVPVPAVALPNASLFLT